MALLAQQDFREINFSRSLMIGDSLTDMEFGKSVGMWTLWVSETSIPASHAALIDGQIGSLTDVLKRW
jgi:histidinol phosphatase-like enzyme